MSTINYLPELLLPLRLFTTKWAKYYTLPSLTVPLPRYFWGWCIVNLKLSPGEAIPSFAGHTHPLSTRIPSPLRTNQSITGDAPHTSGRSSHLK